MPLAAILALLGIGGAGLYIGKRWEESSQKELQFKTQAECFALAKQGKVDPKRCTEIGKDGFAAVADVAEEIGKAVIGASVAYAVAKIVGGRK